MNTEGNRSRMLIVGFVCLVIGYFIGREHVKYELRHALQGAVEQLQTSLSSAPSSATDAPPSAEKPKAGPAPITVALVTKGFSPKDLDASKFSEEVTFTLLFKNQTGKDIRAFDGVVEFTDLLGNHIDSVRFEINKSIAKASTLTYEGAVEYNQFEQNDQRLRAEDQQNLKINCKRAA